MAWWSTCCRNEATEAFYQGSGHLGPFHLDVSPYNMSLQYESGMGPIVEYSHHTPPPAVLNIQMLGCPPGPFSVSQLEQLKGAVANECSPRRLKGKKGYVL